MTFPPMPDSVRQYLHLRLITDEMIKTYKIGYAENVRGNWITIPVKKGDGTSFLKLRAVPGSIAPNKYAYHPLAEKAELYGRGLLSLPNMQKVVICEGEFDAMLLISRNIPAVTSTSGAQAFREEWCALFPPACHIVLAFDADAAGNNGRAKVRALFRKNRPDCILSDIRFDPVADGKVGYDITDFFIAAGSNLSGDPIREFWDLEDMGGGREGVGNQTVDAGGGAEEEREGQKKEKGGGATEAATDAAPAAGDHPAIVNFLSQKELIERTLHSIKTFKREMLCDYPIDQLNTTLAGIFPGETVVVMADSGAGKSDFLRLTAERVTAKGKKVLFYQLEMDQQENTRRKLLKHVNKARRTNFGEDAKLLTAIDLATGQIDEEDARVIVDVMEKGEADSAGLTTYAGRSLTLAEFLESIRTHIRAHGAPDLICLDHIHYFSREEGMPETESLSHAARQIRSFCIETNIPVLMAAHVRKRKKTEELTPDEIHGSGNILKECTTCIALTRRPGETHVAIWKSRIGGELMKFDQLYDIFLREWNGDARNVMGVHEESFEEAVESVTKTAKEREKSNRGWPFKD